MQVNRRSLLTFYNEWRNGMKYFSVAETEEKLGNTLLDILREEKSNKYSGGIYHKTQINYA